MVEIYSDSQSYLIYLCGGVFFLLLYDNVAIWFGLWFVKEKSYLWELLCCLKELMFLCSQKWTVVARTKMWMLLTILMSAKYI